MPRSWAVTSMIKSWCIVFDKNVFVCFFIIFLCEIVIYVIYFSIIYIPLSPFTPRVNKKGKKRWAQGFCLFFSEVIWAVCMRMNPKQALCAKQITY